MSNQRIDARRTRALLGGAVVMVSLAAAGALGGVGLAKSSVSAAQYQYGKVVVCHKTHSKKHPQHTITVSQSAWKAHQKHGDTLGACTAPPPTTTTNARTTTTAATSAASPGKSGEPHGKSGEPHGNSGNGKGHG